MTGLSAPARFRRLRSFAVVGLAVLAVPALPSTVASAAPLNTGGPRHTARGASGTPGNNVYIADEENGRLLEVSPSGSQSTVPSSLDSPEGLAIDGAGDFFVAETFDDKVIKITPAGVDSTVPLSHLGSPIGLAVDAAGDLFVVDSTHNKVDKITPAGVQSTVATKGLSGPFGVAVDGSGNVFVSDQYNNRVVEVNSSGVQSTLPITGLNTPTGLALDSAGDLYVADPYNYRIVELTSSGSQIPIASPSLGSAQGLSIDSKGDVYVAACEGVVKIDPSDATSVVPTTTLGCAEAVQAVQASRARPTQVSVYGPDTLNAGDTYSATAGDNGDPAATFSLAATPAAPSGLTVDGNTGAVHYRIPNDGTATDFAFAITAMNSQGSATGAAVAVTVTSNSKAPTTITIDGPLTAQAGSTYSATAVADGYPAPTFSIGPSAPPYGTPPLGLTIDAATGAISYPVPTGTFAFGFTIVATNSAGSTSQVELIVVPVPTTEVTVSGPPTVNAGSEYEAAIQSADGNPVPTFALATTPAPPAGMTFDPLFNVVQYAVPASGVSSFSFAITATNLAGSATSAIVHVTVEPPLAPPSNVAVGGAASAKSGTTYTATASAQGYPAPTFTLAATPAAPAGMSIDSASGAITYAVPDTISSFSYAVVATNGSGSVTSSTVSVSVPHSPPTTVVVTGTASVNAGSAYSAVAHADGNPVPTFSIAATPAAPPGLTVNPTTGAVNYSVPANATGSFSFKVVATNAHGSASSTLAVVVEPALVAPAREAPCTESDLQTQIDDGGVLDFTSDCVISLTTPITAPAGDTVTLDGNGHAVVLSGLDPGTKTRVQVLEVTGATVTLKNLAIDNGYAVGADGAPGAAGIDGQPQQDAPEPGGGGTDGSEGRGGGIDIDATSAVTITGVTFTNDDAAGGIGGAGGVGGEGGPGQSQGPVGTDGGNASEGGNGGAGGAGQGGAIYNAGKLSISNSTFANDVASGGNGGTGGPGGLGGTGCCTDAQGYFGGNGGNGGHGGKGGAGAVAQGGAVYSTKALKLTNVAFSGDGANAGLGGSATACDPQLFAGFSFSVCGYDFPAGGGWGGDGGLSYPGRGVGNGGNGANGGNGGKGADAAGGAVWSSKGATVANVTFSDDFVNSGHGGADCANSPLTAGCRGIGGPGGVAAYYGGPGSNGGDGKDGPGGTATYIDIFAPSKTPLSITTKSLSKASTTKSYSKTVTASGGSPPYVWSATGLPPGLAISPSGVISGTPTATGTFALTITVADPDAPSPTVVSKPFSLRVGKK